MIDAARLTAKLGGTWHGHGGTAPCPVCQPERRRDQHALSLTLAANGQLLLFCHKAGCSFRDIMASAGLPAGSLRPDPWARARVVARQLVHEVAQREKAARLWEASQPIAGTMAAAYLRGRGITCALPEALRWLSDCWHAPSARHLPAMVARVSSGGVHRTFFEKSGDRIAGNAKLMLGPCAGGAVDLGGTSGPLVVAEGIETALSLGSGLLSGPVRLCAALSTSGMRALSLPEHPHRLIVAADGDTPGRAAAQVLAERASILGWEVSLLPAPDGADWNDVLTGKVGP